MYHCHILEHEDRDMMRPIVIMPAQLMPFMSWGEQPAPRPGRQGVVSEELIAVAAGIRDTRPGQSVVIGSSSQATHRMVGSVAVSLARHAPVPLEIVP
jgi:Multicopper oxidase